MTNVFANNMEISGKASSNKSVAALPDVCLSPPAPPAGPVPIPYPNTAMASDTADASKTVVIAGKPVGMKNSSKYKTSTGNEPATNSFGAGVVSHKIKGASRFAAWSFDVLVEGENVTRFMDLTTHNHMNTPNGAITSSMATLNAAVASDEPCEELSKANDETRAEKKDPAQPQAVQDAAAGNVTITHGVYTSPSGVRGGMRACSRQVVGSYDNSFEQGLTLDEKEAKKNADGKVKSGACGDHVYNRAFFMPHTSHTEARMLEAIFKSHPGGGGKLVMSVDWPGGPNKGLSTKSPCDECKKLICAASECMEIYMCNEDDEAKKPNCD